MEIKEPSPVAAVSNAWVCGRSLVGIAGSNPAEGHRCPSLVNVVCFQVLVSATSWSIFQRSSNECVSMSVTRRINNPLHLQCFGRSQTKRERNEIKDEITKVFKTQGRVDECIGLRSLDGKTRKKRSLERPRIGWQNNGKFSHVLN